MSFRYSVCMSPNPSRGPWWPPEGRERSGGPRADTAAQGWPALTSRVVSQPAWGHNFTLVALLHPKGLWRSQLFGARNESEDFAMFTTTAILHPSTTLHISKLFDYKYLKTSRAWPRDLSHATHGSNLSSDLGNPLVHHLSRGHSDQKVERATKRPTCFVNSKPLTVVQFCLDFGGGKTDPSTLNPLMDNSTFLSWQEQQTVENTNFDQTWRGRRRSDRWAFFMESVANHRINTYYYITLCPGPSDSLEKAIAREPRRPLKILPGLENILHVARNQLFNRDSESSQRARQYETK